MSEYAPVEGVKGMASASPADVEKGMKMAEQEMEYRVELFNK